MALSQLDYLFTDYLESELDPKIAEAMGYALRRHSLIDEGNLLLAYLEHGSDADYTLTRRLWNRHTVHIGQIPPQKAHPGDLWFDVVELSLMALIPPPSDVSHNVLTWVSTHPTYTWQFRTFLRLAEWKTTTDYFTDDLMTTSRFEGVNSLAPITNLYYEEAAAYALWFSKSLTSQFNLEAAQQFLAPNRMLKLLPRGLRLWQRDFGGNDYLRVVVGADTLKYNPYEDLAYLKKIRHHDRMRALRAIPGRMLYGEWERQKNIGFITKTTYQPGLLHLQLPADAHAFIRLYNSAPRPELYQDMDWIKLYNDILRAMGIG